MRSSCRAGPRASSCRITVIADLHAGGPNMTLAHMRQRGRYRQRLRSDLIVLLGDYIATLSVRDRAGTRSVWSAELARLNAPLGVWAILGNHDWWNDLPGVRAALAGSAHIPVLENDAVLLGASRRAVLARRPRRSARSSARPRQIPRRRRSAAERWRRSRPTTRFCCSRMSRIFFRECRRASR